MTYLSLFLFLIFFLSPFDAEASDSSLERDLQRRLGESRGIIGRAMEKLRTGAPLTTGISELKVAAEGIKATNLLLQEKFRARDEEVTTGGTKALERQTLMSEGYGKALEEYLSLIDSLPPDGTISRPQLENLAVFLDKIIYKKKKQIFGSLPYRKIHYPSREPSSDPSIIPAYKGGNKIAGPDDLKSTEEAPISIEIATLAQSLNWNPVSIYEYVKNTIETEWYWGCMKGAEETLMQRSGNDCDQASLLVALLRASGFPARYVRGTIEFFAGGRDGVPREKAKNLLGIDDPWKIAEFFQKAGIPCEPILSGGTISNFQIEHLWVESQIPYANYRGAIIDDYGKTWLGLDTSIKAKGYTYNTPTDIFQQSALSNQLSAIRDEYLSAVQAQTPLGYLQTKLSALGYQASDLMMTRTLIPEVMNILPASMQFVQTKITHEYAGMPDELKHKVKFIASDAQSSELLSFEIETFKLSNQQIVLVYEPETVEDQQIIDYYGSLDNTPAYLVRLRPVLKVNGERLVVGTNGLPMGADTILTIEVISPNGTEKVTTTHITGNLVAIGIVSQKALGPEHTAISEEDDAETILFKETNRYIDRWNKAEEELASLMHLVVTRPIPAIMTVGGVIDVTYVFGTPHSFTWKGIYADANLRAIETTISRQPSAISQEQKQKLFMQLSALQGSVLEYRLFEDDFQVESISTAKLVQLCNQPSALNCQLLTIDKSNIASLLPNLLLDEGISEDITNAVNQNYIVRIPRTDGNEPAAVSYKDWGGTGYVKENLATGEAGHMLSGMIAGGMTAVSPDKWTNQSLRDKFSRPNKTYTTLFITSPKDGTIVSNPQIEVKGTVLDTSARVEVNGIPAVLTGNTFTAAGIVLKEGVNSITATATNVLGKTASATVYITYRTPIMTYITFPYEGGNLSVTPIDVEGIVSDPAASVEVNGIKASVRADGRFIALGVSLNEGSNKITANASKSNGQTGSYSITVNYHSASVPPMSLSITSPTSNVTINRPSVIVRGTVTTSAQEVSIKVNGVIADVYGSQFVANNVPLTEGSNTIIVNALDSNGAVARAEVTVTASTTSPYITLNANITSGIPTLTTYFSVTTAIPNAITTYQIDFEGDGIIDYTGGAFDNISHTYTTEGIFYPTLTVTDDQGNTYADTIAITVLNKADIDALLKSKWEGMRTALITQNVDTAADYFTQETKTLYRNLFNALHDNLPQIALEMQGIQFVSAKGNTVKYRIRRSEMYGGKMVSLSYHIYFVLDSDGLWKIYRY